MGLPIPEHSTRAFQIVSFSVSIGLNTENSNDAQANGRTITPSRTSFQSASRGSSNITGTHVARELQSMATESICGTDTPDLGTEEEELDEYIQRSTTYSLFASRFEL